MELFEIEKRFADPKKFGEDIKKMIEAENLKYDIKKTIAGVSLFHQKGVPLGDTSISFFNGTFDPTNTNITNSFSRPEAEHVFISGIRIWQGDNATNPEQGSWASITDNVLENATFTVTVNGVVMLKNYPVRDALNTQTGKYDGLISLKEIITWIGQTELKIDVDFKSPITDLLLGMRFELIGVGLVS